MRGLSDVIRSFITLLVLCVCTVFCFGAAVYFHERSSDGGAFLFCGLILIAATIWYSKSEARFR